MFFVWSKLSFSEREDVKFHQRNDAITERLIGGLSRGLYSNMAHTLLTRVRCPSARLVFVFSFNPWTG